MWIATFHTTGVPSYLPSPELRREVEGALEAGATVVAVHGSHLIGPVERRGAAVVAWGLGNLVFHCECTREDEGLVLEVRLAPGRVLEAAVVPVRAGLVGPARPAGDADGVFDLLEALGSSPLRRRGDRAFLPSLRPSPPD